MATTKLSEVIGNVLIGVQGHQGVQGAVGVQGAQGATGGFSTNSDAQINSLGVGIAATGAQGSILAIGSIKANSGFFHGSTSSTVYQKGIEYTTSTTAAINVDTWGTTSYRSAKYAITTSCNINPGYEIIELTVLHDGSNVYLSQYGQIRTRNMGTFDASVVSGNVYVYFTPATSDACNGYGIVTLTI